MSAVRRALIVGAVASALIFGLPLDAQAATTGGYIYNVSWSEGPLKVTSQRPMSSYRWVSAGQSSSGAGVSNAQGFSTPSDYEVVNVVTGYRYKPNGGWVYMCCNGVHINVYVDYLGNGRESGKP